MEDAEASAVPHRSVLAARAGFAKADLVLGGRMPSAKVFLQIGRDNVRSRIRDRLIFVDMRDASSYSSDGIKDRLPISRPLIKGDQERKGQMGILDPGPEGICRGDILRRLRFACPLSEMRGVMRWEDKTGRLRCLDCGSVEPVPEKCPTCGAVP